MKRHFIGALLFFLCLANAQAQQRDARLESMMTKRVLTREDVALNIASLTPGLYKDNKTDTIKQLIEYYENHYGTGVTILPIKFLLSIKERHFKEEMKQQPYTNTSLTDGEYYQENIIAYLQGFYKLCSNMAKPGVYNESAREQYIPYLSFIGNIAKELKSTPGITPAEDFLVNYYAKPLDTGLRQLDNIKYNGTVLQTAWLAYNKEQQHFGGTSIGLVSGVWAPLGNLSLLGPHPYFGLFCGGRARKFSVEGNLNLRFLKSPNTYTVIAKQNTYNTNYYFGGYIGADGMYEIWRKKKNGIELLGGIAFESMDALKSDSKDKNAVTKSINTLNLNAGIGYRFFIKTVNKTVLYYGWRRLAHRTNFIAIQAKYNVVNYINDGGTPLDGNCITIGILYGGYTRWLD